MMTVPCSQHFTCIFRKTGSTNVALLYELLRRGGNLNLYGVQNGSNIYIQIFCLCGTQVEKIPNQRIGIVFLFSLHYIYHFVHV